MDNCIEQLKDIEDEFKDDGVKIRMRQKEFRAPQYLIEKMKQRVKELIFQTVNYRFEKIGNSFELTDDNNNQLNRIAQHNYCRIEKIETKSEMKIYPIPKALSQLPNMSSSIIQQSKKFYSSLSVRKISVLNGSIEIYLTDQTISIPVRFFNILYPVLMPRQTFIFNCREMLQLFHVQPERLTNKLNISAIMATLK